MPQFIYHMKNLRKVTPQGKEILKGIWLSFFYGAKIGVIGHNGAGKSTLLRIMAGLDPDFDGEAKLLDGYTVGMLPQEPVLPAGRTVQEVVEEAVAEKKAILARYDELAANYSDETADEMGRLQDQIDAQNLWELDRHLEVAMDALRLPPADQEVSTLSGGEKRRVALCRLLLTAPDLLLLDEPTNHLDAESVAWLEHHLQEYKGTVVAITHDRYFLDNVAGWILELDRGHGIPWQGNYSSWLEQKQRRLAVEQRTEDRRQKAMARELEWIRSSAKARQSKGQARLNAYEAMLKESVTEKEQKFEIVLPPGPRLGTLVVEAQNVAKGYGDNLLFEKLNFTLPPGGIVGVIGPNGAGKTTLFRMIVGQETPDSGTLRIGETVKLAYVDQSRDSLPNGATIWEAISGGQELLDLGGRSVNSRAYCAQFGFTGADQQKKVGVLSGGERNRVHLARLLKSGGNLIL
ncbi:MAG TPA: energy-dependent translational throttle protein EttA, partial [Thermoanaerobaculia bacterium]|nr:energy-dependent translational throttle protein EttA [Thermoanaerobaculia bacterium]